MLICDIKTGTMKLKIAVFLLLTISVFSCTTSTKEPVKHEEENRVDQVEVVNTKQYLEYQHLLIF